MYKKIVFSVFTLIASFMIVYSVVSKCPLLPGIDGPYYLVQTNYLLKYFKLKYMDPPLAFFILAFFRLLIGDPFTALKVGICVITSIIAVAIFFYADYFIKDEVQAFLIALTFVLNSTTFRLLQDFWKNLTGLIWIVLSLYFTAKGVSEDSKKYSILASIFIVLTYLTHILDAGVITLIYIFAPILLLVHSIKSIKKMWIQVATVALMLAAAFIAPIIVGGDIAKGVAFVKDLLEIEKEVEEFPPIAAVRWSFIGLLSGAASLFFSLYYTKRKPAYSLLGAVGIALIALNIPFIERSWLWRFQLMNGFLLTLALSIILAEVKDKVARVAILLLLLGFVIYDSAHYLDRGLHPSIPLLEYAEIKLLVDKLPSDATLLVPNAKLRYWVETVYENVVKHPTKIDGKLILVIEKKTARKRPPWPLFFRGKFIEAYIVPRLRP
mgnify:CR=1 FL=1